MGTHGTYDEVMSAHESSGYYTSFRPDESGGTLVCVSAKDKDSRLHGNSFLVMQRNGTWYISAWGGETVYQLPKDKDVVALSLTCLELNDSPIAEIPETVIHGFQLQKITRRAKDELFP